MKTLKFPIRLLASISLLVVFSVASLSADHHEEGEGDKEKFKILVFSKTAGFRHGSIEVGAERFKKLGEEHNIGVTHTEDASVFTDDNLKNYKAIVFLNTTGDILDRGQEVAMERFVRAGGGWMGVHSASDTEYGWPWFVKLVGGNFQSHPHIQKATITVLDNKHPSTKHLGKEWERRDEWYNFKNLNPDVKVLLNLEESTYQGGNNGEKHPIAWYHEYDGGRAFYTGGGHTNESYAEEDFIKHLVGGLAWVTEGDGPNYEKLAGILQEGALYDPILARISSPSYVITHCSATGPCAH